MCCFVFFRHVVGKRAAAGFAHVGAELPHDGLTPGAVVSGLADGLAIAATGGNAAVAAARPASSNRLRRENIARAFLPARICSDPLSCSLIPRTLPHGPLLLNEARARRIDPRLGIMASLKSDTLKQY